MVGSREIRISVLFANAEISSPRSLLKACISKKRSHNFKIIHTYTLVFTAFSTVSANSPSRSLPQTQHKMKPSILLPLLISLTTATSLNLPTTETPSNTLEGTSNALEGTIQKQNAYDGCFNDCHAKVSGTKGYCPCLRDCAANKCQCRYGMCGV